MFWDNVYGTMSKGLNIEKEVAHDPTGNPEPL